MGDLDIELVSSGVAQGEGEGGRVCAGAAHVYVGCTKSVRVKVQNSTFNFTTVILYARCGPNF